MGDGSIQVAVVGMGDIGRGWAAMIAAAGWPVAIYDNDGDLLDHAPAEIASRARNLVTLHTAGFERVEAGLKQITVGRSLLQACRDAQWVIEAVSEDAKTKARAIESIESAAEGAQVISSSTTALTPTQLVARARRPERILITHPLNPPELIPAVEIVAGDRTDPARVEVVKGWLRALGRIPVTVKKPVLGNVAGRIAAAVWREAIDLVLKGVIDVDDLDRAVSVGPALGWAAAGPHLSYHLAAGENGVSGFFQELLATFDTIWEDLADWKQLDSEQQQALISQVQRSYKGQLADIRPARDRRLAAMLRALEDVKMR